MSASCKAGFVFEIVARKAEQFRNFFHAASAF
jgi:3-methyladenine DNA glycosylase Tag